ncbi:MAG: hypothetical protein Kow006_02710 [Gammaproteobacteria bacterium]
MKLRERFFYTALMLLASTSASSEVIFDTYIGGSPTSSSYTNRDVIGDPRLFDTTGIEVSRSGSVVTFDIYTNFAGRSGQLFDSYTTDPETGAPTGIGYGDLFLSDSWSPFGSDGYAGDNATNGTHWSYGLVLDDRFGNSGGDLTLYELNGSSNTQNALLSDDFMVGSAIWRSPQEVAINTASETVSSVGVVGSWSVGEGYIRLTADLGLTNLLSGGELAFHWAMTCANDVIEGSASVPEPSSLALLGGGLIAVAVANRRRRNGRSRKESP